MTKKQILYRALNLSFILALIAIVGNIVLLNSPPMYETVAYSLDAPQLDGQATSPGFWDGVDARYLLDRLFTLGWGLAQIIIGAWAAVAFKRRNKDDK